MERRYTHWKIIISVVMSILSIVPINISHAVIIFRASPTGRSDIYIMNDEGKHVRQITETPVSEYKPRLSPNGKYIVFGRNLGPTEKNPHAQQFDIFIMDVDGSNERRLTNHPQNDTYPCWSPDGKHIAFTGIRDMMPNIHILELTTGNIRQLTKDEDGRAYSSSPSWSPDGRHIVHEQVIGGGGRHIYITDIDGKNTRPFLQGPQPHLIGDTVISKYQPRWSPDGRHILYKESHKRYEPNRVVRLANHFIVVDKHGRNLKKLDIPKTWWLNAACWAANGAEILFTADLTGWDTPPNLRNYNIYRYRLSDDKITQITNTPYREFDPHWVPGVLSVSPEGKLNVQWGDIKEEE